MGQTDSHRNIISVMCFATTVVQRLVAAEHLCVFDVGLDLVQSLLRHVKRGMKKLLTPVTRELLEKCLFMLKLASDDDDEEVVRNVLFVFEQLHGREH